MRLPLAIAVWLTALVMGWMMGVMRVRLRYIAAWAVAFGLGAWAILQFSQG